MLTEMIPVECNVLQCELPSMHGSKAGNRRVLSMHILGQEQIDSARGE